MVIGISGKAKHGKDTVGQIIQELLGEKWQIKKFASKLKIFAADALGVDPEVCETHEFKDALLPRRWWSNPDIPYTGREFLIDVGMALRKVNPSFWANALLSDYTDAENFIITDVRFKEEAAAIEKLGGIIIRVVRPGVESIDHESETALDNYNFYTTIVNSGSMDALKYKVSAVISTFIEEATVKTMKEISSMLRKWEDGTTG